VGPLGLEPRTYGFTFRSFRHGVGLYHHLIHTRWT